MRAAVIYSQTPNPVGNRLPSRYGKLAKWSAIVLVAIYFLRGTVLPLYLHVPDSFWILLTIATLSMGIWIAASGRGKIRWSWGAVIFAFGAGFPFAVQPMSAGLHWVGIVWLLVVVGPLISNPLAMYMRFTAWNFLINGMAMLTWVFVAWYLLHLPNFGGQVYFTGFMNQSMLLGPIVGMGVSIVLARALHSRSWKLGLLAMLGAAPLMASGSRLATLATGAAVCFLLFRRKPVLGAVCALVFGLAITGFIARGHQLQESDSAVGALAKKGIENSRVDLWQARIDEFYSSPFVGIGVGMGTGSGTGQDADGSIRVEPGSSYLAILAMTGGLGMVVFFSALGLLVFRFATMKGGDPLECDILGAVGIYLAVHGIAEGWILGFGSPLAFIFWLWLGRFGDVGSPLGRSPTAGRFAPPALNSSCITRPPRTGTFGSGTAVY